MSIATIKTFEIDGKTISIETGRLARHADGAVVAHQFHRVEVHRGVLDAHAHGREEQRRQDHSRGLQNRSL